jgi:hypothetical protein
MLRLRRRNADPNFGITAGQRFRQVGVATLVWEVAAISRYPWEALPHVRLHRVGAPGEGKTIALAVLLDARFYLPAG